MRKFQQRYNEIVEVLRKNGVANEHDIRGCSDAEITAIEHDVGVRLPDAYREFLRQMGRGAGEFYCGTDLYYPTILGLTEAARQLVAEDDAGIELPADAIAWAMHQGYQFLFVRADEGNDPPVYHYMETTGEFVKKSNHLTEFLFDVAHDDW